MKLEKASFRHPELVEGSVLRAFWASPDLTDITPVSLRQWRRRMAGREDAPPGWTTEDLQAENRRLREQLPSVTAQRDILKKACGILSEAPTKGMPQ